MPDGVKHAEECRAVDQIYLAVIIASSILIELLAADGPSAIIQYKKSMDENKSSTFGSP